ncbi:hypothetical protein WA1_23480 [Scytonema hofmannii PCC 7110]|uniref:Uncharacterized protein n=1 Tax=Scytonema hofmannii PCC 7110 TaxID=128403 RepID=A0A139X8T0_9CYAN|nr:hypothetical protein [Scytonema hofmannii]KYC41109.1 hypothetical protein WA1_23480 [Scytonema hofmannii PCC 7110]
MPVTELLQDLQKLSRADKLKVMQFLILELSREEETESSLYKFQSHVNDTMNSPYDSYEAAHKMNKMLEDYKHSKNV